MLLCDGADAVEGKLYILGGGWSHTLANVPVNMALAIMIAVPWNQANEKHDVHAALVSEDGETVEIEGNQVIASGELEVGRPAGLRAGTQLNTPLVLGFNGLVLKSGGYVWELRIGGEVMARAPFQVVESG
jgi:hypothetical protein